MANLSLPTEAQTNKQIRVWISAKISYLRSKVRLSKTENRLKNSKLLSWQRQRKFHALPPKKTKDATWRNEPSSRIPSSSKTSNHSIRIWLIHRCLCWQDHLTVVQPKDTLTGWVELCHTISSRFLPKGNMEWRRKCDQEICRQRINLNSKFNNHTEDPLVQLNSKTDLQTTMEDYLLSARVDRWSQTNSVLITARS